MKYVIEKASVKPYTRVRRGKFEHVKGYDISRMTQILDRPVGPFSGRERHVMISELAKRGYRYLGDANYQHEQADPFLMESYGIQSIKKVAIPFRDGHSHYGWIGRPTNKAGKDDVTRLAGEKLPFIGKRDTLPKEVASKYVSGPVKEKVQLSYKGTNFQLVNQKGEWNLKVTGWDKPLDESDPNYHIERLHRESAKTYQKYIPLGMRVDKFSKEYVLNKLLNMGYEKKSVPSKAITKPTKKWKVTFADGSHVIVDATSNWEAKTKAQPMGKTVVARTEEHTEIKKGFLQDAMEIITAQPFVDKKKRYDDLKIVMNAIKAEEDYDGNNITDDSKDSKAFHKDLFDVEDELMDFIHRGGAEEDSLDGLNNDWNNIGKNLGKNKDNLGKSGGICPHDGKRGVYLRRYYQAPYWLREYKCPAGHIFQEVQ